jgi:hypothetical protein
LAALPAVEVVIIVVIVMTIVPFDAIALVCLSLLELALSLSRKGSLVTPDYAGVSGLRGDGRLAVCRRRLLTRRNSVDPDATHASGRAVARRDMV